MKTEWWSTIERAYHAARDLKDEDRSRFLDDVCGPDAAMRKQIEALLQQDEIPDSLLNRPALEIATEWPSLAGSFNLLAGMRFGAYEILQPIGSGGMGVVYRACDTKLHRDVALKFLPAHLATDPDRLSRFRREAQVLAALNHPHIAQIYGLEESESTYCIAMELVDGETLAQRLQGGALPVDEALRIAKDIAGALEAAHEKDIVHRDLKPANVKITPKGTVKVLDFGLAKARPSSASDGSPSLKGNIDLTEPGIVLGSAPYMSPEQAKGLATDHRSDVFAFGCVLYEMLTGRQPFQGETVSEVIASVLTRDPDLERLPAHLDPRVRALILRCFEKDIRRRWQAIGDVRVEIEIVQEDPLALKMPGTDRHRGRRWQYVLFVSTLIAGSLIGAVVVSSLQKFPPQTPQITRLSVSLPENTRLTRTGRHVLALSSDGSRLAFVANNQLNLRNLADMETQGLPGTDEDVSEPFFSPDGRWIGFWSAADHKLKKVAVAGGPPVVICDASNPSGASWLSEDQIIFGQGRRGVVRVAASGGKPETIISVGSDEHAHGPQLLPDGDTILFTLLKADTLQPPRADWDHAQIVAQSLKTGVRKLLINGGADARYVPSGHIIYARGSALLAASFDLKSFRIGESIPVVEDVSRGGDTGAAQFSFSGNGTMVYVSAQSHLDGGISAASIDLDGHVAQLDVPSGQYANLQVSPDASQIAMEDPNEVIWIYDVDGTSPLRKLNQQSGNSNPRWTQDGSIIFTNTVNGQHALSTQRADGSAPAGELIKPGVFLNPVPMSVSPDRKILFFKDVRLNEGLVKVYTLDLNRGAAPKYLFESRGKNVIGATLSPDGRWLAYELGQGANQSNIYVVPFPPNGVQHEISTQGGWIPMWSRDSRRLYYVHERVTAHGPTFWSVDIQTEPSFRIAKPRPLFTLSQRLAPGLRVVDFSPATNKFVALFRPRNSDTREFSIVLNWFADLKRRVPMK